MSRWHRQHGCVPTQREWDESAGGSRPWSRTIHRRWGWHAPWGEAVGFDQVQSSRTNTWLRRAMIQALLKAHAENSAWPSEKSWERTTAEHPARRTYVRRFGSWAAAVGEAEWEWLHTHPALGLHPAAHECKPDQPSRIPVRCGGAARAGRDSDRAAFSTPCPGSRVAVLHAARVVAAALEDARSRWYSAIAFRAYSSGRRLDCSKRKRVFVSAYRLGASGVDATSFGRAWCSGTDQKSCTGER